VNSCKRAAVSAVLRLRSAMTCRASSLVVIGFAVPQDIERRACRVAPYRTVRAALRELLANALDIVTRIEDPKSRRFEISSSPS
jgi:hypothetical protein